MVAPVVGETNLFIHSCCIIRPATLIPTPVHRIARRWGSREMKREAMDSTARIKARITVSL